MGQRSLDRLHFFLVPTSGIKIDRHLLNYHFREIGNSSNLWVLDTNALNWEFHSIDSFSVFLYPVEYISVGIDIDGDNKTDLFVGANTLDDVIESGSRATYTEIVPNYRHLTSKASGFVIGIKPFKIIPKGISLKLLETDSYKDLISIYGVTVDEEVPLSNKEFIYWKYKTIEGL